MKPFTEALADGFIHITEITDKDTLKQLRDEGILIDTEGYYVYSFGPEKEYELCIEPTQDEGTYFIALYKNRVLLTEKLLLHTKEV